MPVQECTKNESSGHRWDQGGVCFMGKDSRARAAAVGVAINAQKGDKSPELQQVAESFIASLSIMDVLKVLVPDSSIIPVSKSVEYDSCVVKKTNEELQLVYAEVYSPDRPDTQGDFMTSETIRCMAHEFLENGLTNQVDLKHDNDCTYGCAVVESFIARDSDDIFIPDSWVVACHIDNSDLWQAVKSGEINGFSMQANVRVREKILEIDIPDNGIVQGETGKPTGALEGDPGHTHKYTLRFSDVGDILGGETDYVENHRHMIRAATVTEPTEGNPLGHSHRFSFLEGLGLGAIVAGGVANDQSF